MKNLIENHDFIHSILESIDQAIIITDLEGVIQFWNDKATELYEFTEEEAVGKNIQHVTLPQISLAQGEEIMKKLIAGKKWKGEFIVHNKSGKEFEVFVIDSPLYHNGELIGIIGLSSKVEEIIETRSNELLAKLSIVLDDKLQKISSEITHKLNNNLMVLNSNLYMIKNNKELDKEAIDDMIEDTFKSIKNIESLTQKVQILNGKSSFSAKKVNLIDFSLNIKSLFQSLSLLELIVEHPDEIGSIIIDANQLQRLVFTLILSNQNFEEFNLKQKKIWVNIQQSEMTREEMESNTYNHRLKPGTYISLKIQVPKSQIIKLEKYYDHPMKTDETEIFILINSIKGLLNAYYGGVNFNIENNTVDLIFPQIAKDQEQDIKQAVITANKGAKVLIAEDNVIIQKSLTEMVKNFHLNPIVVSNGLEAKHELENNSDFSFCIIDLKMPVLNGIEFTKFIKENYPNIPVLLISGYHEDIDIIFNTFDQVPNFLAKPFTEKQLHNRMSSIVRVVD